MISEILDAKIAIKDVGSFYNDTVKNSMQQLMILDLSPYWPERVIVRLHAVCKYENV